MKRFLYDGINTPEEGYMLLIFVIICFSFLIYEFIKNNFFNGLKK